MSETNFLLFLLEMKTLAKEARARKRRIHYCDHHRARALEFTRWVESQGGTVEDAAELMTMHKSTLRGWIPSKEERPEPREIVLRGVRLVKVVYDGGSVPGV